MLGIQIDQVGYTYGVKFAKDMIFFKYIISNKSDNDYDSTPTEITPADITYSIMGGQRVYLLSHDSSGPKGRISLSQTLYGIPQDRFIGDENSILNKTYPTVRGDELMKLLRKMFAYVTGHVHPVAAMPPVPVAAGNGQTSPGIQPNTGKCRKYGIKSKY